MSAIHASCVAIDGVGVLLRGPSGSGKSDLALRLIDGGAHLVADDQVCLSAFGGRLVAAPPANLRGLLEVRGLGIVRMEAIDSVHVGLVAELFTAGTVERLPETTPCRLEGVDIPRLMLRPFHASSAAIVRQAVQVLVQNDSFVSVFGDRTC